MRLLGFRFAPRIRDLGDTKLYIPKGDATTGVETDDRRHAQHQSTSAPIGMKSCGWPPRSKQGTATASLMLAKLGGYPRQNGTGRRPA